MSPKPTSQTNASRTESDHELIVAATPFEKRPVDTPMIMRHVIYALLPATAMAVVYFGISALLLILTCIIVLSGLLIIRPV